MLDRPRPTSAPSRDKGHNPEARAADSRGGIAAVGAAHEDPIHAHEDLVALAWVIVVVAILLSL